MYLPNSYEKYNSTFDQLKQHHMKYNICIITSNLGIYGLMLCLMLKWLPQKIATNMYKVHASPTSHELLVIKCTFIILP